MSAMERKMHLSKARTLSGTSMSGLVRQTLPRQSSFDAGKAQHGSAYSTNNTPGPQDALGGGVSGKLAAGGASSSPSKSSSSGSRKRPSQDENVCSADSNKSPRKLEGNTSGADLVVRGTQVAQAAVQENTKATYQTLPASKSEAPSPISSISSSLKGIMFRDATNTKKTTKTTTNTASPSGRRLAPRQQPTNDSTDTKEMHLASALCQVFSCLPPESVASCALVCRAWASAARTIALSAQQARFVIRSRQDLHKAVAVLASAAKNVSHIELAMHCELSDRTLRIFVRTCGAPVETLKITFRTPEHNFVTGEGLSDTVSSLGSTLRNLHVDSCLMVTELDIESSVLRTLHLGAAANLKQVSLSCPAVRELSIDLLPPVAMPVLLQSVAQRFMQTRSTAAIQCTTRILPNAIRGCGPLSSLHVSAPGLTDGGLEAVLKECDPSTMRHLSITHCPLVTDQGIGAICKYCHELLSIDLSGCTLVGDQAVHAVAREFTDTLTSLRMAACPRITSVCLTKCLQFLPELRVLDAGYSMQMENPESVKIKHRKLEVLSVWGCSSLSQAYLVCPRLRELNLHSCSKLKPERMGFNCPALELADTRGCDAQLQEKMVRSVKRVRVC